MKYRKIIDELAACFDLSIEVGRKEAYNRCFEYAAENLSQSADCNLFLAEAAEVFGQMKIHMNLIEGMVAPTGAERIHMVSDGNSDCVLTGNRSGLVYLSKVFRYLSEAPMENEHVHFMQGEPAMKGNTYNLTVYYEPDEWFDRYAQDFNEADEPFIEERKISAGAVIALCVTVDFPPMFYMSKDKIYRVLAFEEYEGQEDIVNKRIRESIWRMYTFTLVDDRGEELRFAFDLDDWTVVFFTVCDLEQIIQ